MGTETRYRTSPTTVITRSDADRTGGYVVSNEATGTAFLAEPGIVRLLEALDGTVDAVAAGRAAGLSNDALEQALELLASNGLIVEAGTTRPVRAPVRPWETRALFFRFDLVDLGPLIRRLLPVTGLFFTLPAAILWSLLMTAAALALIAEPEALGRAARSLLDLSWEGAIALMVIFAALKAVHEMGHATALAVFTRAEGLEPGPIRAGVSFFALMPFPYTDATRVWHLRSRGRRAMVGLAGLYFESWIAAGAALVWATIRPGEIQTILFQVLLISGVSTLLFNLNPLVRLDGYFVMSDLMREPNLATRATQTARAAGLWLIGGPWPAHQRRLLLYWVLSYGYRWTIFATVFWLAYLVDPRLGWPVAGIALISLVLRPLWTLAGMARRVAFRPLRAVATCGALAGIAALFAVPLPDAVHLDGRITRTEAVTIRAETTARLLAIAEATDIPGTVILRHESPELDLRHADLLAERARFEALLRGSRATDATAVEMLAADLTRLDGQIAETAAQIDALTLTLAPGERWEPLARDRIDGWLAAYDNHVLGQIVRDDDPVLTARLDQSIGDLGPAIDADAPLEYRAVSRPDCTGRATVREVWGDASDAAGFHLDARPDPDAAPAKTTCLDGLPEGSAVILRLRRADAPLAVQLYNGAQRLAQNRLPRDTADPNGQSGPRS